MLDGGVDGPQQVAAEITGYRGSVWGDLNGAGITNRSPRADAASIEPA